jgi:type I restriction enzyme M protein
MTYWAEIMQDDVYMIAGDGWREAARPRPILENKTKTKEKADFTILKQKFKAELIPPVLIIARYFAAEQAEIERLEAEAAIISQKLEELKEEHGGEEGLLEQVIDDKGGITKGAVATRIKEIRQDPEAAEECALLIQYLDLVQQESDANHQVKEAQQELEAQVAAKYGMLSEDEIKTLVVDDKWLARLEADVRTELDRVSHALADRIRQLAERYESPLPQLDSEVESLSARVAEHLKSMGAIWD